MTCPRTRAGSSRGTGKAEVKGTASNRRIHSRQGSPRGKIGGAAQKRLAGNSTVLHHVTMAYDMDADKMLRVLRIGREKLSDKGTTSTAPHRVSGRDTPSPSAWRNNPEPRRAGRAYDSFGHERPVIGPNLRRRQQAGSFRLP
ncbi:lipoyl protein ligase domain-containing protein [Gemmobacter nectariphilus]|uniref:lipoyl protein ligase domain-containing protein n=1 Tax=Gemmobacter nectariphilus TaxID=220343 RepID=UPI0003FABDF9